ncbi:MAG: branched-chain amino acid ABC transporter permease [Chloroflexi bacterium]|nr:MAG: branched-chain amino acid ABC transporter permease [Chloroflexota bacterium]
MENPSVFFYALLWLVGWGTVGAIVTPQVYTRRDKDISQARLAGALMGAATGPFGLIPLWIFAPDLSRRWVVLPGLAVIAILVWAFAQADPDNLCVTRGDFVATQIVNGLIIGSIYGLMALGLTLIFSILGIVSFAHGEFYMIGGMVVFYMSDKWFPGISPILAVLAAAAVTMLIGLVFERLFLRAMNTGQVERPGEYAILVTFGLAFFLQYTTLALVGANPKKVRRFFDYPRIALPSADQPDILKVTPGNIKLFDTVSISTPRFTAMVIALILLVLLLVFLYRTWYGKALRAVSQDRQAAAVTGINPNTMNTLAFGLGGMLAGISGASLVQVFSWVPWVGVPASSRSFVIIVLGGMGSLPGAFIGGLVLGLVEALGAGCVPDPQRAAAYIPAYGMVILVLVLLLKPTGLFGREL